jgi:O-antigen/teichoic acid export membrane protein
MQMDKIMLGTMLSLKTEVGIYSVATNISSIWYFIPATLIVNFKPFILENRNINYKKYLNSLKTLYSLIWWIGIFFGTVIFLISYPLIFILYGESYINAHWVLSVSIWSGTFAMLGSARESWLVSEDLIKYSMFYLGLGVLINTVLNYIFIPYFQSFGAAFATLITQFSTTILTPLIFKKTRISSKIILESLAFWNIK